MCHGVSVHTQNIHNNNNRNLKKCKSSQPVCCLLHSLALWLAFLLFTLYLTVLQLQQAAGWGKKASLWLACSIGPVLASCHPWSWGLGDWEQDQSPPSHPKHSHFPVCVPLISLQSDKMVVSDGCVHLASCLGTKICCSHFVWSPEQVWGIPLVPSPSLQCSGVCIRSSGSFPPRILTFLQAPHLFASLLCLFVLTRS